MKAPSKKISYYQLYYYVPSSHLAKTKRALFAAGAGKIGKYSCCAWQSKGIGQFKPLANARPYLGNRAKINQLDEYRVEMLCEQKLLKAIVTSLRESHPYEEPVFGLIRLATL